MTSKIKVDNISDQNDNNIINESGDVITVGAAGDTVAVAGNIVKSNAYQASDGGSIISQSGTTITIGASGDTVSLASGASQSGFGRSGSVDWQTTPKTATFTAASGEGYFCNTSGGAFTVNLPAGSAGAIVAISDYTRTFNSNNLTISPNGSEKIGGVAADLALSVNGQALTLVYVDGTEGWINVQNAEDTETGINQFISATGGTITQSGDYRIHTFTGPGTFTVCSVAGVCGPTRNNVSYLVVAGGASGGSTTIGGGGGGAGGFREYRAPLSGCYSVSPLNGNPGGTSITVTAQAYPIAVGAGGASGPAPGNPSVKGNPGSVSTFSTVTSAGGGGGAADNDAPKHADPGGSGGGGYGASGTNPGGTGNTPPTTPSQGNNGGTAGGNPSNYANAGGGGGATAVGESITGNFPGGGPGGNGGAGATTSITASPVAYAGGGGASADNRAASQTGGDGGTGGGGQGGDPTRGPTSGTANTGGGGGGQHGPEAPNNTGPAGAGGSGIVVIRYKYQ
jgi:hypothetical protein